MNIVALYQGRSEAGPRALGNRSILYDPTDPNGKDHVNVVKGREWFRPFAGSMLQEHFEECQCLQIRALQQRLVHKMHHNELLQVVRL